MDISLEGWSIGTADAAWAPWGADDKARAQVLASGDGYLLVLNRTMSLMAADAEGQSAGVSSLARSTPAGEG